MAEVDPMPRAWRAPLGGAGSDQAAPVDEASLRVDTLRPIPSLLRTFGVAPPRFFAEAGVDPRLFEDPDNQIPFTRIGSLLRLAVARTRCPHFGLLVGQQSGLSSLGPVGLLVQQSPDVGTALRNLIGHVHLRDRGGVVTLSLNHGVAVFGYAVYQRGVEGVQQICDGAIAIGCNIMRELCGPSWTPSEVLFSRSRPDDVRPFSRFFRAPVRFDAEQTALAFPEIWLERRTSGSDPALYQLLARRVDALEERFQGDLVGDLRRVLRVLLLGGSASVEKVAEALCMHRRTLNRRLHAQGTSVQDLLEEVRFEVARQLVAYTHMPLTDVAVTLGYSDASAFTRAFRRWTGSAPAAWRRGHGLHPPAQPALRAGTHDGGGALTASRQMGRR
jgi:AraC-like DNA-binding protein